LNVPIGISAFKSRKQNRESDGHVFSAIIICYLRSDVIITYKRLMLAIFLLCMLAIITGGSSYKQAVDDMRS
jgi:hypothetical protein